MTDLWVDPDGDDTHDGLTSATAKGSWAAAIALTAAVATAASATVALNVVGRPGKTLNVSAAAYLSSTANIPGDARIVLRGVGETQPIVTARTQFADGWKDVKPGLVRRVLPVGLDFRDVWLANGTHVTQSSEGRFNDYYRVWQWDPDNQALLISSYLVPAVNDVSKLEMVIVQGWSISYLKVHSMASAGGGLHRVFFDEPPREIEYAKGTFGETALGMPFAFGPYHASGQRFWWEGAKEFLYEGSKWTVDGGYLYVSLPPGVANAAAFMAAGGVYLPNGATTAFSAFRPNGEDRVRNLTIDNIGFQHFGWNTPNTVGYVGYLSGTALVNNGGTYAFSPIPAVVSVAHGSSVEIKDCSFRDLGAMGVLATACQDVAVEGNRFEYIGATALMYGWSADNFATPTPDELNRDSLIRNNYLRNIGNTYMGSAVFAGAYKRLLVEHNHFEDCADDGLGVGVGALFGGNAYGDWTIRLNKFIRVMTIVTDGAAIYVNGNPCGQRVYGPSMHPTHDTVRVYLNYFENVRKSTMDAQGGETACVYFDLGTQGGLVYCNVAVDCDLFANENCAPYNTFVSNKLVRVVAERKTFYSGFNVEDGAGGYILYEPPLNNPPTTQDNQKFYGTDGWAGRPFYEVVFFSTPQECVNADGTYNTTSTFANNNDAVNVDARYAGVQHAGAA